MLQPTVVLRGQSTVRVAGMPVHDRNRRAAERAGAVEVEGAAPAAAEWLLSVPATVAIEPRLVAELRAVPAPVRLVVGSQKMVWGPGPAVRAFADGEEGCLPLADIGGGAAFDVANPAGARAATAQLLLRTQKATDGPVSRTLNRPMSRFFSRIFLALRLAPIHASAVSLAIGLAAAWFAAQPGWLGLALCGFLFQAASMFDGVDGEMARVTLSDSVAGARIDTAIDNITYLACLAGFVVGWVREGAGAAGQALAAAALLAVPVVLFQVLQFTRAHSSDRSLVFFTSCVHRAAARSADPGLRLASLLFPALRRDVLALLLMLVTFTGSRAAIAAAVVAGCAVAAYTLLVHRRSLIQAAAT